MSKQVFKWIKTPCGRSKYLELQAKQGFLAQLRLNWFILFAAIKDWNLPNPDQNKGSDS